jgi:hypothetical protein
MIGGYLVCVENGEGRVVRELDRTTRSATPIVGDEVVIDGAVFHVHRVRHEEDALLTRRVYTVPRVFVRRARARSSRP